MESVLTKKQVKTKTRFFSEGKDQYRIIVNIRYDDECGNGHNSFAITADIKEKVGKYWREHSGGCCHDEIAKRFPEFNHLIKWHLFDSEGPMHYLANTLYLASDKDCHGLKAGEFSSFVYEVQAKDEVLFTSKIFYSFRNWLHRDEAKQQAETFSQNIKPELNPKIVQVGSGSPSVGKKRKFDAARSCAVWPDATDEQLTDPNLEQLLKDRLSGLVTEFKAVVESLGFVY